MAGYGLQSFVQSLKARDDATSFLDLLTEKHATVSSWLSELDGTCNPRVQQSLT